MGFAERLRAFEARCERAMETFRCSVHLSIGQEAVPEVLAAKLRPTDWVFSTHRSHGHYLAAAWAKGDYERAEAALWDELNGLASGVNGGYSGSQSFCDPRLRFHSTAVVGGLIGVATGAALASKLAGIEERVVCCLGDAATEQGIFWESLNFASLHALPILFVVENNGLSVHSPLALRQARPLQAKAMAFGVSYWEGLGQFSVLMDWLNMLPALAEVPCTRECRHVSAMEDLRE
jgi:TPP-dependent pyruvate/acetoin dehydrogenase alpha subunit